MPGGAIATLHGADFHKSLLHGMKLLASGQPLDGRDVLVRDCADARDAGTLRFAVDEHGAGAALSFAASVLTPGEIEMLAQDRQETGLRIDIDGITSSVDGEAGGRHAETPFRDEPELYVEIIYLMRERGVRNAPNIRAWHDRPGTRLRCLDSGDRVCSLAPERRGSEA